MLSLPITSLLAASLVILMCALTMLVSARRVSLGNASGDIAKYVFGHGDDETLRRRVRAFGNFIEYVPMALVMLVLLELQGAPSSLVWGLGGAFVVGRYLHAFGMLYNPRAPMLRIIGMIATYSALLTPAFWLLLP